MKPRSIIIAAVIILVFTASYILGRSSSREKIALEKTRAELHQQGFKTDLSEFDFSSGTSLDANAAFNTQFLSGALALGPTMNPHKIGRDSALVLWKGDDSAPIFFRQRSWSGLRSLLDSDRSELDTVSAAVLSDTLRFNLDATAGSALLLPHLAPLRNAEQLFASRAILELHDGNRDAAWTNFLVSTRITTAWDAEPIEISQLVKMSFVKDAFDTSWQMLQAGDWSDERLAALQQEWEKVDFFAPLPETFAYDRARDAAMYEIARQQPVTPAGSLPLLNNPRAAAQNFAYYWHQLSYSKHGSYEDEKNVLLYYRDLEVQTRRAIQSQTWAEMRNFPAATNLAGPKVKNANLIRMQVMANAWQIGAGAAQQIVTSFQGPIAPLFSRAAESEARRRVLITAIALERYHAKRGAYPQSLDALTPEFLKKPLPDFMDGAPLHYHLTDDGHFVLYSLGLDCIDHGGELATPSIRSPGAQGFYGMGHPGQTYFSISRGAAAFTSPPIFTKLPPSATATPNGRSLTFVPAPVFRTWQTPLPADIVWPRPATDAEIQAQRAAQTQSAPTAPAPLNRP